MLRLPWFFDRFGDRHLFFKSNAEHLPKLSDALSAVAGRCLVSFPPGMVRFLFIDPVGLGKNFAGFHALSDYDDKVISGRVWSDRKHIRDELAKVVEHIEIVVQKYLRTEFPSIDDYNIKADQIAEPYRFVVINGFPENFDSESCLALERIVANGPKCGVHVLMLWDTSKPLPHGVTEQKIVQNVNTLTLVNDELAYATPTPFQSNVHLFLDAVPEAEMFSGLVVSHGERVKDGSRVVVPFTQMMERLTTAGPAMLQGATGIWTMDNSKKLIAPLGPTGARKIQQLNLGEGGTTAHHALIVGKTGSGKSNLLHVMIMSMAELYSPDDLELYLIDFKKGVEFKDYAEHHLPHARVIAIESEVEFGISVLRGMDAELTRRGELFRGAGIQELEAYRRVTGTKLPRSVMIIDEFHELVGDEGSIGKEATTILERIVRQGRSFGLHLILASQSIAGVRLPKGMLDQIGVRIAMQCSAADSILVLADDNKAARLLDRAGEAIYNDRNGLIEGNNTFQVALLNQEDRVQRSLALRRKADEMLAEGKMTLKPAFIFEGNLPAQFENCHPFNDAASQAVVALPALLEFWIGEPIAMKPALSVVMKRQSGAHMLVIDRDEKLGFGVIYAAVLSAIAQHPADALKIDFVDLSGADESWAEYPEALEQALAGCVKVYGRKEMPELFQEIANDIKAAGPLARKEKPTRLLVIFGLQRARDMRLEDAPRPSFSRQDPPPPPSMHDNMASILREGPDVGAHVLLWCDTLQGFQRALDNKSLSEFGHRVVGGLSTNDSNKLLEDSIASKMNKENRMIVLDDDRVGVFNQIRPYLPPEKHWLTSTIDGLAKRHARIGEQR